LRRVVNLVLAHPIRALLLSMWLCTVAVQQNAVSLITDYGLFTVLGIVGAVFANATGAGGGVVFVPFFNYLAFDATSIVATSFAIQCCGMTAGAITWWRYKQQNHPSDPEWYPVVPSLRLTLPFSALGLLVAQFGPQYFSLLAWLQGGVAELHIGFGIFSIFLAIAIFASIPLMGNKTYRYSFIRLDTLCLPVIGFVGGIITAWLSVGVGELVAVYLIIRGFNITMAIASAVILSALSVWCAIVYHITVTEAVIWPVVLFAGAGAIMGGMLAKYVVLAFSPQKLKIFFGAWVLVLGVAGLPVF